MIRVALYARTSTLHGQDPGVQLGELRQLAATRGWHVVEEHVDRGVSGVRDRRPALDRLLAGAQRGEFEVVLTWKLDRLGRSLPHLLQLLGQLDAWGVQLVSARDPGIDTTTPTGRLLTQLLGAFAQFERDLIRERVVAGVRAAQARGVHCGRPSLDLEPEQARRAIEKHGGVRPAARALGVSPATVRRRAALSNLRSS